MKSAEAVGPSKNASQDWSAGLMRRLRPSLVISTWRTFGGKVMDFGKRTAWLRLVVNTVERVTLLLRFSTSGISHWDIRNRPAFVNADSASGKAGQLDRAAPATNGVTPIGPFRALAERAHQAFFACRLRRRTPGPPPSSSMNSTPAASKARRTAKSFAMVIDVSLSASSARLIVASPNAASRASSAALHRRRARAARIWALFNGFGFMVDLGGIV